MEQKKRFNIVDVLVIVLLLAAVLFAGWKFTHRSDSVVEQINVTYKVRCEEVPAEVYESCLEYLPCTLMASGELLNGEIQSVEKLPFYVPGPDGAWLEDPDHVTLVFTVSVVCNKEAVMMTKVGEQEVRIGRTGHILKSEYLEFHDTVITDVQWGE